MSLNDFSNTNALESNALFILPEARSVMSPVNKTEPKRVPAQRLELTAIPKAMRSMGWTTPARLMERWLSTPAWTMPPELKQPGFDERTLGASHYDDTIITMAWATKFERLQEAMVRVQRTSFHTKNGLDLLNKRLDGWDKKTPYKLGYYGMPVRSLETLCQVNATQFGNVLSTLDDMYGALGEANLKIGVIGTAFKESGRQLFHADHVGLYILDQYDFNGWQYLGTWTKNKVLTKAEATFAETYTGRRIVDFRSGPFAKVFNHDFRRYRDRTGRGGDFVVFSDVLWKRVDKVIDLEAQL